MMARHFIHYNRRQVVSRFPQDPADPWFAEVQSLRDGFATPRYHITRRADGPAAGVRAGDTIWLVGQLFSPWGALPPALDARIEVDKVRIVNGGCRRFDAKVSSAWFPLADLGQVLEKLETVAGDGAVRPLRSDRLRPIGYYLQSMRTLLSGKPLQAWEQRLKRAELHFISYRICDGTRSAIEKARELVRAGHPVFWDRWSLPRRLAERRELVADQALDAHIMEWLEQSKFVWGIESDKYSVEGSYSESEQRRAKELGTYRSVKIDT